jgi:multiple sugar transport system substrate-binding protein
MMRRAIRRLTGASLLGVAIVVTQTGCASGTVGGADGADGRLTLWTHNGGNTEELAAVQSVVDAYNASQDATTVELESFPQASYGDSVVAAAAAGKLPCLVDIDGPNVPNWAWAGYLAPLDLDVDLGASLPSTVGTWDGETYAVGQYDVSLAMFARKSVLERAGIRIATLDQPWTRDEFDAALAALAAEGAWKHPLDLGTADVGEWYPYAYSPLLQSAGGDLLDRDSLRTADGLLDGPAAVEWATWMQGLVADGYASAKSGADPALDLVNDETALMYGGSWASAELREPIGDDLAVMPPPDLGDGVTVGGGSWQWGVTTGCADPAAAMDYLSFSLRPESIATVAEATGTIPATDAAAALVPGFEEGGELAVFRESSERFAQLRPATPAYPFISSTFTKAVQDILAGADPRSSLADAVRDIDGNISSNDGYAQDRP